jgi:NTE family protein
MLIGLTLGGGAVRGLAHLGVLSVLEEATVPIEFVSGCSAGAVLGAIYCAGMPIEQIKHYSSFMGWRRIAQRSVSYEGIITFEKMERWLIMLIGDVEFSDLKRPFAVVTMDADSGERIVLSEGRVAPAVRASCSIPGLVTPVKLNGRHLVDGGIVDNLPVNVARELGADYVIGVDVVEPLYQRSWGPLGKGMAAFETLIHHAGGGVGAADYLIKPKLAGYSFIRFSKHEELIALGREAAEQNLPCLLDDLHQKQGMLR